MSEAMEPDTQHFGSRLQPNLFLRDKDALKDFRQINGPSKRTDESDRTACLGKYGHIIAPGAARLSLRLESLGEGANHLTERFGVSDVLIRDASDLRALLADLPASRSHKVRSQFV